MKFLSLLGVLLLTAVAVYAHSTTVYRYKGRGGQISGYESDDTGRYMSLTITITESKYEYGTSISDRVAFFTLSGGNMFTGEAYSASGFTNVDENQLQIDKHLQTVKFSAVIPFNFYSDDERPTPPTPPPPPPPFPTRELVVNIVLTNMGKKECREQKLKSRESGPGFVTITTSDGIFCPAGMSGSISIGGMNYQFNTFWSAEITSLSNATTTTHYTSSKTHNK